MPWATAIVSLPEVPLTVTVSWSPALPATVRTPVVLVAVVVTFTTGLEVPSWTEAVSAPVGVTWRLSGTPAVPVTVTRPPPSLRLTAPVPVIVTVFRPPPVTMADELPMVTVTGVPSPVMFATVADDEAGEPLVTNVLAYGSGCSG